MDTQGKRLRLLYPDIHGLERGKYLFGDWASTGMAAFCIGVYPLTHDKEILPVPRTQFDVGLHDVEAFLDHESLRPGWEEDTVLGIADVQLHGEPAPWDTRHALREAVLAWRAMDLEAQVAFELEFYLLEPGEAGGWQPVSIPGHRVYGTGMAVDPSGTIGEVVNAALASGFPVESWCSEYDNAAYEVNIRYADAIQAADEAFLFKLLVREICERRGKLATFLGRPLNDRGGSGLHVNLSFRRPDGSNAFHDPSDPEGLSDLARHSIAGLLAHHEGMAALLAPHVNAYKRLQPDMLNGYWANWGHDDRSVTVRVPPARGAGTRLEQRTSDAAANPYLAAAAILHAARLGVEQHLEPPPPQPVGEDPNTDLRIPPNLDAALNALAADEELVAAVGPELVTSFTILKRAEWERYLASGADPATTDVTPWELSYYLPFH
jgi:glutamine synthetase